MATTGRPAEGTDSLASLVGKTKQILKNKTEHNSCTATCKHTFLVVKIQCVVTWHIRGTTRPSSSLSGNSHCKAWVLNYFGVLDSQETDDLHCSSPPKHTRAHNTSLYVRSEGVKSRVKIFVPMIFLPRDAHFHPDLKL